MYAVDHFRDSRNFMAAGLGISCGWKSYPSSVSDRSCSCDRQSAVRTKSNLSSKLKSIFNVPAIQGSRHNVLADIAYSSQITNHNPIKYADLRQRSRELTGQSILCTLRGF
jgi:hypothetical protein